MLICHLSFFYTSLPLSLKAVGDPFVWDSLRYVFDSVPLGGKLNLKVRREGKGGKGRERGD